MGRVGLTLITGPANAGKVALLLRRYLEELPREPVLIVPNRSDVEQAERELLELEPALLGGTIGTFDDLFRRIAKAGGQTRPVASDAQRILLARRAVASARAGMNGLGRSARFGGFADALLGAVGKATESSRPAEPVHPGPRGRDRASSEQDALRVRRHRPRLAAGRWRRTHSASCSLDARSRPRGPG